MLMRILIINGLMGCAMGWLLRDMGIGMETPHYWAAFAILVIAIVNSISE